MYAPSIHPSISTYQIQGYLNSVTTGVEAEYTLDSLLQVSQGKRE